MGKTYRRDKSFRPKQHGRVFTKEEPWQKNKRKWDKQQPYERQFQSEESQGENNT